MLELFALYMGVEHFSQKDSNVNLIDNMKKNWNHYVIGIVIVSLLIAFASAYLAYACNQYESPASRALYTLFGFFFSGIYLIYYFIIYILLNKKCNGKDIAEIMKKILKK